LTPNTFWINWLSNISVRSVPKDGYYRNAPCTLILKTTFLLQLITRFILSIKLYNIFLRVGIAPFVKRSYFTMTMVCYF